MGWGLLLRARLFITSRLSWAGLAQHNCTSFDQAVASLRLSPSLRSTWRPRDNIPQLAKAGRLAAAGVLAALAVVRPPAPSASDVAGAAASSPDAVEAAIMAMAAAEVDGGKGSSSTSMGEGARCSSRCAALSAPAYAARMDRLSAYT